MKQKKPSLRKSVSFGENSASLLNSSSHSCPPELEEEPTGNNDSPLWYTKEEYRAIRQDMKQKLEKSGGRCSRGLELVDSNANASAAMSKIRRKNFVQSLLSLQADHRDHQLTDELGLQRLASAMSKEDMKEARIRATNDSLAAFELHSSEHGTSSSSLSKCCHELEQCCMKAKTAEEYSKPVRSSRIRKHKSSPSFVTRADADGAF